MRPKKTNFVILSTMLVSVFITYYIYGVNFSQRYPASPIVKQSGVHTAPATTPLVEQVTITLEPVLAQRLGKPSILLQEVEHDADDIVLGWSDVHEFVVYDRENKKLRAYSRETQQVPSGLTHSDAITKERAIESLKQICEAFGITYQIDAKEVRLVDNHDDVTDDLTGCSWAWLKRHRIGEYDVIDRAVRIELSAFDGTLHYFSDMQIGPLPSEQGTPISLDGALKLVEKERQISGLIPYGSKLGYVYDLEKSREPYRRTQEPPHLVWSLSFTGESCLWYVGALDDQFVRQKCFN